MIMRISNKNTRHFAFDLIKGIACIGVVLMHFPFPGKVGGVIHKSAEFAVPAFIMISGFFAYGVSDDVIRKRLFRTIKIFIFSFVMYSLYRLFELVYNNQAIDFSIQKYMLFFLKMIVFCTVDYAIPLWYLIAMIETYIFWLMIHKYLNKQKLIITMTVLIVLQIVLRLLCESMDYPWHYKINFITGALSWLLIGYCVNNHVEILSKINYKAFILFILLGYIIALLPLFYVTSIQFSFVGVVIFSISIFMLAVKYKDFSHCDLIEFVGKELSLDIYVFHLLIGSVLRTVLRKVVSQTSVLYLWVRPIAVVIISIGVSYTIYCFRKKIIKKNPL